MAIKVSIIEDDPGTLDILARLIDGWPALVCVSRHARLAHAISKIPEVKPDVVLVDLELGKNASGIECIRALKDKLNETQFLVYSKHNHAKWIFPALREGASGYILKDEAPTVLLEAIQA